MLLKKTFTIEPHQARKLNTIAKKEKTNASMVLRRIIDEYLKRKAK